MQSSLVAFTWQQEKVVSSLKAVCVGTKEGRDMKREKRQGEKAKPWAGVTALLHIKQPSLLKF
jgi:hypothetical protein